MNRDSVILSLSFGLTIPFGSVTIAQEEAQQASFEDIFQSKNVGDDQIICMDRQTNGEMLVGLWFTEELTINQNTWTSQGGKDSLFVVLTPQHNIKWAKHIATINDDEPRNCQISAQGEVYLSMKVEEAVTLDGIGHPFMGGDDIFIAKLNRSGDRRWSHQIGSASDEEPRGLAISASDVFIGFNFNNNDIDLLGSSLAGAKAVLARIDLRSGRMIWHQKGGDEILDLQISPAGFLYATGTAYHTFNFLSGSHVLHGVQESSKIWLARFNPSDASVVWHQFFGGTQKSWTWSWPKELATDSQDDVILVGSYEHSVALSPKVTYQNEFGPSEQPDSFLAKFEKDQGRLVWSRPIGSSANYYEWRNSVAIDTNDAIYVTSTFIDHFYFEEGQALSSNSQEEAVGLAKYDRDGNLEWQKLIQLNFQSGSSYEGSGHLQTDAGKNQLYIAGFRFSKAPSITEGSQGLDSRILKLNP